MRIQWTANGNRDAGSSCLCDRGLHRYLHNFGGGGLNTLNPPSWYATVLSQRNLVHALATDCLKIHFKIILPPMCSRSKCSTFFPFPKIPVYISCLPPTCYMSHQSYPSYLTRKHMVENIEVVISVTVSPTLGMATVLVYYFKCLISLSLQHTHLPIKTPLSLLIMNIIPRDMCCYRSLIILLVGCYWAMLDHSLLIMNGKCSNTDCVKRLLIDYDWRCMIRYVTDHDVSPAFDDMAAPDIDHTITPAADHDCKTRLSYQFPPHSSCWLPFKVHTPYVLFALSKFAKGMERTDGTVTCWLSAARLSKSHCLPFDSLPTLQTAAVARNQTFLLLQLA